MKAVGISVICSFLFLFASVSARQEKKQNILHLIESVEMGKALQTLHLLTPHVAASFSAVPGRVSVQLTSLNHLCASQIFDLQLIY